jgi:hypothetical protein
MDISTTVIPGHRQRVRAKRGPMTVNPESRREYRPAVSLLDSGFKRCALAPE